MKSLRFNI